MPNKDILIKKYVLIILALVVSGTSFYLFPHLFLNKNSDFISTIKSIGSYAKIFGVWNKENEGLSIFNTISSSVIHLSNGFFSPTNIFLKSMNVILTVLGFIISTVAIIKKNRVKQFNAIIILTYFMLITFIINIPNVNDYWIFLFPFLLLSILLQIKNILFLRSILLICLVFIFSTNLISSIYPQSKTNESGYWISKKASIEKKSSLAMISAQPYSHQFAKQAWHLSRLKDMKAVFLIMNPNNLNQIEPLKNSKLKNLTLFTDFSKTDLENFFKRNSVLNFKITLVNTFEVKDNNQIQSTSIDYKNKLENWHMNQFSVSLN